MKAIGKKIIVKADTDQKDTIIHGTLKLYSPHRRGYNENGREVNPVLAEVVSIGDKADVDLFAGNLVVLGHNSLNNKTTTIGNTEDGQTLHVLGIDRWIIGEVRKDRDGIRPILGNITIERIEDTAWKSDLIVCSDATEKKPVLTGIVKHSGKVKGLKKGDKVLFYFHSDYEVVYNLNGREYREVVIHERDLVGKE